MARKRSIKGAKAVTPTLPIALVFGYDRIYGLGVLRGIARYAHGYDNWVLVSLLPHRRLLETLHALKPAGIIVGDYGPRIQETADTLRKTHLPVVDVTFADQHFPRVAFDEASIGVLAAKHLLECGLKNFGYFGPPWGSPTSNREGGFYQTLQRLSHTVSICHVRPRGDDPVSGVFASQEHIFRWLAKLPKPAGVFAPLDTWALWLRGVCRQEGIKVPEEVAIIGAENDELLCEMSQPSISSIALPAERIGYETAAMLDRLICREPVPSKQLLLPAAGVITRQSTNILAGVEPGISTAVGFIREHISEPITVEDVVQQAHLPRRSFERKFREAIGRSPAQEISRLRIGMAKNLLAADTQMKTDSIARQCGFSSRAQFFMAFQQATGVTPAKFRRTMEKESRRVISAAKPSVKKHRNNR